ncbi:MAG: DUF2892 domain-containing protein [Alphaproteobacteria bacterium]
MQCNLGQKDRALRTALGLVIIGIGLYQHSWWGAIGLVLLASAATGYCCVYAMCGCSSKCGKDGKSCSIDKDEPPSI